MIILLTSQDITRKSANQAKLNLFELTTVMENTTLRKVLEKEIGVLEEGCQNTFMEPWGLSFAGLRQAFQGGKLIGWAKFVVWQGRTGEHHVARN